MSDPRVELEQLARKLMEDRQYTAPAVLALDLIDAILKDHLVVPRSLVSNIEYAWRHPSERRGMCQHRVKSRAAAIQGAAEVDFPAEAVERVNLDWNVIGPEQASVLAKEAG